MYASGYCSGGFSAVCDIHTNSVVLFNWANQDCAGVVMISPCSLLPELTQSQNKTITTTSCVTGIGGVSERYLCAEINL